MAWSGLPFATKMAAALGVIRSHAREQNATVTDRMARMNLGFDSSSPSQLPLRLKEDFERWRFLSQSEQYECIGDWSKGNG